MTTHPMKLVTIIGEALAREPLLELLRQTGAQGWTLFSVEGSGKQGSRPGDIEEFGNIQLEIIVPPDTAQRLLERLQNEFFPRYAMVAYQSDINVLRPTKFGDGRSKAP
jgi:nitrogen regulatory protein PII